MIMFGEEAVSKVALGFEIWRACTDDVCGLKCGARLARTSASVVKRHFKREILAWGTCPELIHSNVLK